MISQNFSKIWYASEKKINSIWKFIVFDDRGSLNISPDGIEFKGKKNNIRISTNNLMAMSMTKPKAQWGIYLTFDFLAILYICLFFPKMIIVGLVILVAYTIPGLLIVSNTKWVLVEYLDQNNNLEKAYFADGSMLGWSGILGGTKKIYNSLKSAKS